MLGRCHDMMDALKKMLDECIVKEGEKLNGEEKEF